MPYPEETAIPNKQNAVPFTDPQTQLSADEVNEINDKINKNALFYGIHANIGALTTAHPSPKIGGYAFLQDGTIYRSTTGTWITNSQASQNNKSVITRILINSPLTNTNEVAVIADQINKLAGFTIADDEIGVFYTYQGSLEKGIYRIDFEITSGKGDYGLTGLVLNQNNIIKTGSKFIKNDIINGFYQLGDIGSDVIDDYINNNGPFGISGDRFFSATISGQQKVYLYTGNAGIIGGGNTQTAANDFIDIYNTSYNAFLINIRDAGFATEAYVDQAELDANSYTDNRLSVLRYNELKGDFDVTNNLPDLEDESGVLNHEYRVVNAGPTGANKDFGGGNVLFIKDDDVIIFNGTNWIKKVDNNQIQEGLNLIPPNSNLPVKSSVLNDRMSRIFDSSGYRITNVNVSGVSFSSNVTTGTIYFYAVNTDRYLLVDLNILDLNSRNIFLSKNKIYNISTAATTNLSANDIIGNIENQATFTSNPINSLPGISSNFTIFPINQTFRQSFSGEEIMNVSIDLIADLNGLTTQTYIFEDRVFTANELIELVPAPGDNKLILPTSFSASINLSQGFSSTAIFNLLLNDFVLGQVTLPTTTTIPFFVQDILNELTGDDGSDSNSSNKNVINKALQVRSLAGLSGGLGTIKFYLTYKIVEI